MKKQTSTYREQTFNIEIEEHDSEGVKTGDTCGFEIVVKRGYGDPRTLVNGTAMTEDNVRDLIKALTNSLLTHI